MDVLSVFLSNPTEFWPLAPSLKGYQRAIRLARLVAYAGLAFAFVKKDRKRGYMALGAALAILVVFARPAYMQLDAAGLKANPNPAGNALVGDMTGRSLAPAARSLTTDELVKRMTQQSITVDDRQIMPTLPPYQGMNVYKEEPDLGNAVPGTLNTSLRYVAVGR